MLCAAELVQEELCHETGTVWDRADTYKSWQQILQSPACAGLKKCIQDIPAAATPSTSGTCMQS